MLPMSLQLFCWQASALFVSSVLYCMVPYMAAREDVSWNGIFWDHSYTEVLGAVKCSGNNSIINGCDNWWISYVKFLGKTTVMYLNSFHLFLPYYHMMTMFLI